MAGDDTTMRQNYVEAKMRAPSGRGHYDMACTDMLLAEIRADY
jgi:hypothetical protein